MSDDKKKLVRRPDGSLYPGQGSLNPGGRPKGVEKRIRELVESQVEDWNGRTLDGWDAMAMAMYAVAMGKAPPGVAEVDIKWKDRADAIRFLYDRVFGKPMVRVESENVTGAGKFADLNVDALDGDELDALEAHVERLAAKAAGIAVGKVMDVAPADIIEVPDPNPDDVK